MLIVGLGNRYLKSSSQATRYPAKLVRTMMDTAVAPSSKRNIEGYTEITEGA